MVVEPPDVLLENAGTGRLRLNTIAVWRSSNAGGVSGENSRRKRASVRTVKRAGADDNGLRIRLRDAGRGDKVAAHETCQRREQEQEQDPKVL